LVSSVFRLKMIGCTAMSFACIKKVVETLPETEILDYFGEVGGFRFVPFHPALSVVDKRVELIKDGEEVVGARISIVASDGEKEYLFETSCIMDDSGGVICYPSPRVRSAAPGP